MANEGQRASFGPLQPSLKPLSPPTSQPSLYNPGIAVSSLSFADCSRLSRPGAALHLSIVVDQIAHCCPHFLHCPGVLPCTSVCDGRPHCVLWSTHLALRIAVDQIAQALPCTCALWLTTLHVAITPFCIAPMWCLATEL